MILTVFTPTFNRSSTFSRIISLICQETIDLQWIIVDGGNDDTFELVNDHIFPSNIDVCYVRQSSFGLHGAYNEAISLANGDYFISLHSDDEYISGSLELMCNLMSTLSQTFGFPIGGVVSTCIDQNKNIVSMIPNSVVFCTWRDFIYKHSSSQQLWPLVRTSCIKNFRFPDRSDVRFYAEGIMWREISHHAPFFFFDSSLRIYYVDEGETGSLMNMPLTRSKCLSFLIYMHYILANDFNYFHLKPMFFISVLINYSRYSFHCNSLFYCFRDFLPFTQIFSLLLYPLGFLRFLIDKSKRF